MKSKALGPVPSALFTLPLFWTISTTTALSQGTVTFNNRIVGNVISHVYLPSPATPYLLQTGNGTADYPAGTTDWIGWTLVSGAGFSAQLFAAPGADTPVYSLAPAFPVTTFRTGPGAGFVAGAIATLPGVASFAPVATVQMRVWDNRNGTITDWFTATAQPAGTELVGMSAPINLGPFQSFDNPLSLVGLQSFNLTYVPEPSPFALTGLGAFLFWVGRGIARRHRPVGSTGNNPDGSTNNGMDIYVAKVKY